MTRTMRLWLGAVLFAAAALLLVAGIVRKHRVFAKAVAGRDGVAIEDVSERDLVKDATFSGVLRRDGQLYSTYDRTAPQGKKSCPT